MNLDIGGFLLSNSFLAAIANLVITLLSGLAGGFINTAFGAN